MCLHQSACHQSCECQFACVQASGRLCWCRRSCSVPDLRAPLSLRIVSLPELFTWRELRRNFRSITSRLSERLICPLQPSQCHAFPPTSHFPPHALPRKGPLWPIFTGREDAQTRPAGALVITVSNTAPNSAALYGASSAHIKSDPPLVISKRGLRFFIHRAVGAGQMIDEQRQRNCRPMCQYKSEDMDRSAVNHSGAHPRNAAIRATWECLLDSRIWNEKNLQTRYRLLP